MGRSVFLTYPHGVVTACENVPKFKLKQVTDTKIALSLQISSQAVFLCAYIWSIRSKSCVLCFPAIGRKAVVAGSGFLCPFILGVFLRCHDAMHRLCIMFSEAYLQYFWYLLVWSLEMTMKNWRWRSGMCFAFLCYGLTYITRGKRELPSILDMKNGNLIFQRKNKFCCLFMFWT